MNKGSYSTPQEQPGDSSSMTAQAQSNPTSITNTSSPLAVEVSATVSPTDEISPTTDQITANEPSHKSTSAPTLTSNATSSTGEARSVSPRPSQDLVVRKSRSRPLHRRRSLVLRRPALILDIPSGSAVADAPSNSEIHETRSNSAKTLRLAKINGYLELLSAARSGGRSR